MTILEQIENKHKASGGHCGMYLANFEGNVSEIKKELNRLHKNKKIIVREGIHGKLIMLNPPKKQSKNDKLPNK